MTDTDTGDTAQDLVYLVMGSDGYPGYAEPVAVFKSESDAEAFIESADVDEVAEYTLSNTEYYTEETPWNPGL